MKFLDLQSRQKIVSFSILFFQDKKMSEKQVKIRRLDRMLFPPFSFENTTIMKINDPKGQVVYVNSVENVHYTVLVYDRTLILFQK